jgi:glutathione S-transferase
MMTAKPVLYSFRRCPYAMRARLAVFVSRTACELREVKLSAKPEEMTAVSPKATVPVIVLPDGRVIDESLDIMRWALGGHDPGCWLQRDDADLIAANDGPFKRALDRYKYPNRHGSNADEHRAAGLSHLHVLDERLARHANLSDEDMGLTDAAIFPFVRQFAETDRAWFDAQPLPHLHAWLGRHLASPLFAAIMERRDPWQPGDPTVFFAA